MTEFAKYMVGIVFTLFISFLIYAAGKYSNPSSHLNFLECWGIAWAALALIIAIEMLVHPNKRDDIPE